MSDEEWVNVALSDDSLVVDLLLRLNRPPPLNPLFPPLRLDWSVRQPRSKSILTRHASDSAGKNSDAAARASPTTPLTWSSGGGGGGCGGATSISGGFVDASDAARSKIGCKSEVVGTMKRPRKKKTLGELKEEEALLLKERRSLKDALATLRVTVEKQRDINGSLKKMKLELELQQGSTVPDEENSDQSQLQKLPRSICNTTPIGVAAFGCNGVDASYQLTLPNVSCKLQEMGTLGTVRLLPDLNLPFQDDSGAEALYRMS
ncbi:hypothetical protein SDJN02_24345 [Cucurbita argyrosperma subsp. argyrosperma]|uniref:Uncharacterized protein LOC111456207 isoform X2 n=1 Tax=Cucurbita moschata TaxID=3662 RepID=A0A6J1GQQ9_CUCMO|nr:uncharacterized protein LOC111456207 isoform X2 [Cucurbita moschata]KAG7014171.1 hypothetical protein SDJN02_24345 [Cucurbita argyrosperma subsp. argyrosperma]